MNHLTIFFNTRIKNTGRLAAIGNFFLAPTRWLFSGQTIIAAEDGSGIAKVSSFNWRGGVSQAYNNLQSTDSNWDYASVIIWPFLLLSFIPGVLFGSFFKALSYLSNPEAQEKHRIVKDKLTPKNFPFNNTGELKVLLKQHYLTGQATNALIISGQGIIDYECVYQIMKINPHKLILDGVTAKKNQFSEGWNTRALIQRMFPDFSSKTNTPPIPVPPPQPNTLESYPILSRASSALSSFFTENPDPFTVPSVKEGLEAQTCNPHTVFVIRR